MKAILSLSLFTLLTLNTWAVKYDAAEVKAKLQAFEYDIQKQTLEKAMTELSVTDIAKAVNVGLPINPPTYSKKFVTDILKHEIEDEVSKTFPKSRYEEIAIQVKKKYRIYELNEKVTIRIKNIRRGGQYKVITGHIRQLARTWIRLGDVKYNKDLIDPNHLAHFDLATHVKRVETEKQRLENIFENQRQMEMKIISKKLSPAVWNREGYIKIANQWEAKETVFNEALSKVLAEKIEIIRSEVESEVYEKGGFCWNRDLQRWEICGTQEEVTETETEKTGAKGKIEDLRKKFLDLLKDDDKKDDKKDAGDEDEGEEDDEGEDDEGEEDDWDDEEDEEEEKPVKKAPKKTKKAPEKAKQTKKQADLFDED
ncbi:MAG: hypothetical protein HRT89_10675 [Lentisphaeria bacterium]|nr:hypothetical protein [Lentisphaeria bacterium]NQZ68520.1 hypothetical protein [Lentisphaeria bacterium]